MLRMLSALALLGLVAVPANAQTYPDRPITLVAPFPPGGVADQVGRPLGSAMEKLLKQPVVLQNKPGAGGAVGMASVAQSRPDGYTLLVALSSISIIPEADKLFARQPAYTMDQLAPIALLSADPTVMVVKADSPWKTVKDFVEDAKKRSGQIAYASSGVYGTLHVAMEMFAVAADIKLRHVPFSGGGPAVTALLGNNVQALASGPGPVLAQIKAGTLRPLGVTTRGETRHVPGSQSFAQQGFGNFEAPTWWAFFGRTGTPRPIVDRMHAALRQVLNEPEVKARIEEQGCDIVASSPDECRTFVAAEIERWGAVIRENNIRMDS